MLNCTGRSPLWAGSLVCGLASAGLAQTGVILVAHGGDSAWNARVHAMAQSVHTGGPPVEVSFLMGPAARDTRLQDAVSRLERRGVADIVLVPLLVSSHSGHYEQIRYLAGDTADLDPGMMRHLEHAGIRRPRRSVPLRVARAMDDSRQVARVLTDRALALATNPRERALLILGHGPNSAEDYAKWMRNLRVVADSVQAWGQFRDVRVELVRDDAPAQVRAEAVRRVRDLIELQRMATGQDVLVVPILVSRGGATTDRMAHDLASLPVVYRGEPLLPHAEMARWVESRIR